MENQVIMTKVIMEIAMMEMVTMTRVTTAMERTFPCLRLKKFKFG